MRAPIRFVYGNCVFAATLDDVWAAFAVETDAYEWLGEDAKRARFLALLGALEAIEADVQILRVGRRWEAARYARELDAELAAGAAPATAEHVRAREHYVGEHARRLGSDDRSTPALFVLVTTSAWMNELSLLEPELLRSLNTKPGRVPVRKIRWLLGR